jgi:hypothetical protein
MFWWVNLRCKACNIASAKPWAYPHHYSLLWLTIIKPQIPPTVFFDFYKML